MTNISPEAPGAEDLAQLYACRWRIELVFKELNSHYRLDELPTRNAPMVEALILSSILTLLVSRRLLDAVRRRLKRVRLPDDNYLCCSISANSSSARAIRPLSELYSCLGRSLSHLIALGGSS